MSVLQQGDDTGYHPHCYRIRQEREEERASIGGRRCSEKVWGALGFELGSRGWIRFEGGQRGQKRKGKEDSYQEEGQGTVVKLTVKTAPSLVRI